MISFPNCKINLGLNIIAKRTDGFHDLETAFYPVSITDALEVIQLDEQQAFSDKDNNDKQPVQASFSGIVIDDDQQNNLCIKAYHLLKTRFPQLPAISMHLHKNIPLGAGLGGGSADGAFMLRLLTEKFRLSISREQLSALALELGSDCPFYLLNKPCFATGRGEMLEAIPLDLSPYHLVIVNPGIHVNTRWAFSSIVPINPVRSIKDILLQPIETWKHQLVNDFEIPVTKEFPVIADIRQHLYAHGALYAAMSGSGSTVYGIFGKKPEDVVFPASYWVKYI